MSYSAFSLCIHLTRLVRSSGSQLRVILAMAVLMAATALNVAHAQEAYPVGFESSLVYSGLNAPTGVAVDKLGNVYIADSAATTVFMEAYQSTGTYIQYSIGTGMNHPYGVAVDSNLNVYITDTNNGRVLEEVPTATPGVFTQSVIMANGSNAFIASPTGIGVDINNNVYVTDPTTGNVIKMTQGTWAVTQVAGYGAGLNDPYGVVLDSNLNIFIADIVSGVKEIPNSCTIPATTGSCPAISTLGTGVVGPKGVAVDLQNNIYIASTGSTQLLKETLQFNGTYAQSVITANGLTSLNSVAVDPNYNIYVGVPSTNQVLEISPFDGNFGSVLIGATSPTLTLTFDFLTGGQIGQVLAVQKGASGSDFEIVAGGTCIAGATIATGASCTVNVQFAPLYAGTRYGAVELINADATPALFATAYIYGTGLGPQVIFLPGVQNLIYGDFGRAATVAVDGNENIFVASQTINTVFEFTAASGYTSAITLPGSYSNTLTDVNVDGAGNVYITEWGAGICYKFFAADGYQTVIAMDSGISEPTGSAVDGNGNVFVSSQTGYVNEILASSDYSVITTVYNSGGAAQIADLAVDGAGDVYDLNFNIGTVTEIMAVDGLIPANPTVTTIISGLTTGCCSGLESIKVDNVGNVYIADWATNSVTEYYVATNFATNQVVFPFTSATDMAIDGQGNIWASSGTNPWIGWLATATAPTLYFNTAVGSTSATQTTYIKNIGNETLVFPDTAPPNPSISQYFNWTQGGSTGGYPDCPVATSTPQSLTVDSICAFPIFFQPLVSGTIDGQLVLSDNTLNTGGTQTVLLYGNATGPVLTVTADSYVIGSNGPAPLLFYTLNGSLGSAMCNGGTPALSSNLPGGTPYPFTNPPIAGGIAPYIVTITAGTFKCSGPGYPYSAVNFVNGTIEVGKNSAQLTLTTAPHNSVAQNTIGYGQAIPNLNPVTAPFFYTLTGFQSTDTQATACTGIPSITTVATMTSPPGTYQLSGDAGSLVCSSANYTYTIYVVNNGNLYITKDTPVISWTPVPASLTVASPVMVAGQFDATAADGATNVGPLGTFTYYLNAVGGTVISPGYTLTPGAHTICVQWVPGAGYTADYNNASLCVPMNVSVTVTANSISDTYGAVPAYSEVSNPASLTGICTGAVTYTLSPLAAFSPIPVASYSIVPGGLTCPGGVVYTNGTLNVAQNTPLLTYSVNTITYGAALSTITSAVKNSNPIATVVTAGGVITYTWNGIAEPATFIPPAPSGTLCEVWTPAATLIPSTTLPYSSEYTPTVSTCETVTVNPATLTITANNKAYTYGATPAFTYTSVPASLPAGCTGPVTYTLNPVAAFNPDPVGSYSIVPAGVTCTVASGYTPTYVNGTLTITKNTPTVGFSPVTMVYGSALNSLVYTAVNSNPPNTNVYSGGTWTYTWGGVAQLGTYVPNVTASTALCATWTPSGGIDIPSTTLTYASQYVANTICHNVSVTTAPISVTATVSSPITYGAVPNTSYTSVPTPLPVICGAPTYTYNPVKNGPSYQVATFTITPGGLTCGTNYTVTYHPATLVVNKDVPTVTITPTTLPYGQAISTLTYDAVNSNNALDVTAGGAFTYTWNGIAQLGTYVPTGSGTLCAVWAPSASINVPGTAPGLKYNAEYNSSVSTCISVSSTVTITAVNKTITYGATPAFTYTSIPVSLPGVCTGSVTYTLNPLAAFNPDPVGSYSIVPAGISCGGSITVSFVNATLIVNQDTPTETVSNAPITYGASLSTIGVTVVNSNNATNVLPGGTLSYTWNGIAEPATYTPSVSGTVCVVWTPGGTLIPATTLTYSSQYTPSASNCQAITVNAAPLTITATPYATAVYDTALPNASFTFTITGFLGNDGGDGFGGTNNVCSGAPTLSTPAVMGSSVGIYTINVSTTSFSCTGYSFVINTGELHITPATLSIVPVAESDVYNSLVVPHHYQCYFGATLEGTDNCGGGPFAITGVPTITTSATVRASNAPGVVYYTSNVGQYSMKTALGSLVGQIGTQGYANYIFSFATDPNYLTITTSPVVLNVQPNNITVSQATCLSSGIPTLTYRLAGLLNWDTIASTTTGAPVLTTSPGYTGGCAKGTYTNVITATPGTLQLDQYPPFGTDYSGITATGTGTLLIN